jgi:hypothetical protein
VRSQLCQMIIGVWGCGFISFKHFGQDNRGPSLWLGRHGLEGFTGPLLFHEWGSLCGQPQRLVLTHNLVINVKPQG